MKRLVVMGIMSLLLLLPALAISAPVPGIYTSTDLGGVLLTGRASTWRPGINSGLPHVLHAQSWNGSALGTQWTFDCAIEPTNFSVQDNRVNGTGTVVYTSTFNGGTFTFLAGGWPWGDGSGTLGVSTLITTVQYVNYVPRASVVNGNSSGVFSDGCNLTFVIANAVGVGETSNLYPTLTKPADYPDFLDATCALAPSGHRAAPIQPARLTPRRIVHILPFRSAPRLQGLQPGLDRRRS